MPKRFMYDLHKMRVAFGSYGGDETTIHATESGTKPEAILCIDCTK